FASRGRRAGTQVEPDQGALGVGQVTDQLSDRLGKLADEGGEREDLIAPRQLRALEEIDHLDAVAALQMLVTDFLQVCQRCERPRGLARDVEAQIVEIPIASCSSLARFTRPAC